MGIDNEAAEAAVARALSTRREDRFDEISGFTEALAVALGAAVEKSLQPWIPIDPELTRSARRRDETVRAENPPQESVPPARQGRLPWLVAGVLALAVGIGAGWAVERATTTERTLQDSTGTISVTVPEAWTAQVDPEQWEPADGDTEAALAAGSAPGWNTNSAPAPGVFVGVLAGEKLPSEVPVRPECSGSRGPIFDKQDGDESVTVFFDGCPGADFAVERVIQVNDNELLWVQIRSDDQPSANRVLDSVEVHGM